MLISGVGQKAPSLLSYDFRCFQLGRETSKPECPSIDANRGDPFLVAGTPTDAPVARRGSSLAGLILHIARMVEDSQVHTATVQPHAINVVNLSSIVHVRQPEQFAMQVDVQVDAMNSPASLGVSVAPEAPSPLHCEVSITGVDDHMRHDRVLLCVERHAHTAICEAFDLRGGAVRAPDAPRRTETPSTTSYIVGIGQEIRAACFTATWDGRLLGHRRVISGGVTAPADLAIGAGLLRVNCTEPSQARAA